ncbi:MAG: selenide, water dikinase, partial [Erysipelotrichaceae bacterium]|nr:selenide, water dikinase [Erysipelotrichaceae bacterium]
NELFDITEADRKQLTTYKNTVDKSNSDEERAVAQLMKLQVVVNEVEVKVREYHIPAIAGAYREDLVKSREYIADIKRLLNEVPLNTQSLNATLDEAIDFIYKFYNNVNNVVGMAIMVENAIVFGNKYRSTYPEIDRELSKAEFSYLNGEYTRALTIAINCMETLFPESADEKILETV